MLQWLQCALYREAIPRGEGEYVDIDFTFSVCFVIIIIISVLKTECVQQH